MMNGYVCDGTNIFVSIAPCQVKGHRTALLNAALFHHTVLFNADVTCVHWYMYFIPCDPACSSKQMIRIYKVVI